MIETNKMELWNYGTMSKWNMDWICSIQWYEPCFERFDQRFGQFIFRVQPISLQIVGAGVATSQWDKMKVPMKKNVYIYIYWYIYILFFLMDRFFASNTTSRRGQGSLLLNDLVPHPTAQIVFPLKMKRSVMFFCPIPPILKYIVF